MTRRSALHSVVMPPAKDQDFLDFVLDQLSRLTRVTTKRMFGGVGLYQDDWFFAVVDDGRLYFLTDEATRPRYEVLDAKPFEYAPGKFIPSYYEVPVDVLENDAMLCSWANDAIKAQKLRTAGRGQPSATVAPGRSSRRPPARGHRPRGERSGGGPRSGGGSGSGGGPRRSSGSGGPSGSGGNQRSEGNRKKTSRKRPRRGGGGRKPGSGSR